MTSFHFNTAASKNARRAWNDFVDERFGVSSVSIGDETTFTGDVRCSSVGFLTLAQSEGLTNWGDGARRRSRRRRTNIS